MSRTDATLLALEDLDAAVDDVPVLRGVTVRVAGGETVALVGRNGAGKTTTFRSVMGLVEAVDGVVRFRDEDITALPTHERKRRGIGYQPEGRRLISRLTARENIRLALWGTDDEAALDEAERFDLVLETFPALDSFLDRPARNLSGGEQQMTAVARALVSDPDLLLLDEPFEGLAPTVRRQLKEGLRRVQDLGVSVFLAESEVNHVTDTADRVYAIERGEIIAESDDPPGLLDNEEIMGAIEG